MLNVALVGLLAGSLLSANPTGGDGDKDGTKSKKADAQESVLIVGDNAELSPTVDTYALGRPSAASPIKFWIEYGFGGADEIYDTAGEAQEPSVGGGAIIGGDAEINSQRAAVGLQINPISFSKFSVGVGGVLTGAKNTISGTAGPFSQTGDELSSDFSVQNVKIFASARGKVLGIHGGYMLDLGDDQEFNENGLPIDISRSDNRDAIQLGVDFDYPARGFRVFGGIDRYIILENCDVYPAPCNNSTGPDGNNEDLFGEEGDGVWNFVLGTGLRVSFAEVGVAAQIVARDRQPVDRNGAGTAGTTENIGGYVSTLSPYLRVKPPSLPASLYVKGGLQDEYNVYGLPIDGANGPKPTFGLTFGLSVGFE
ncbi:hypothetical protein [Rubricoccus marinus]|uniref:Uncharacterized protein n=1 Tax=Rubricoccus marinus TaxID=716817 RepID=A0A259TWN5_9BACT|nr:hypothetical protein [Rubricoccus marinus]OZC01994.1 hypothetical protein BSZ36_02760 [Rubricoccus marinus]